MPPSPVHSDCMRHRSIHEACLDSTEHARVVELLSDTDARDLISAVMEREMNTWVILCTCKAGIELDSQGNAATVRMKNATATSKKASNTTR